MHIYIYTQHTSTYNTHKKRRQQTHAEGIFPSSKRCALMRCRTDAAAHAEIHASADEVMLEAYCAKLLAKVNCGTVQLVVIENTSPHVE